MHRLSLVFTLAVLFGCAFSQFDELDTTALDQSAPTGNTAFDSSIVNQPNSPAPEQGQEPPVDYTVPSPATDTLVDTPPATQTFVNTPPTVPATQGYNGGSSQGTASVPTRGNYGGASRGSPSVSTRGNYGGASAPKSSGSICNPVTGIQARSGSIYAAVLRGAGVQAGNCGGQQAQGQPQTQQGGVVNPITGIRARQGGIYETVLRGAGVQAQGQPQTQQGGLVNPVTGIRARQGGIYETVLRGAGVQPQTQQQGGLVNPITGIRASQGGIYETVLRGAGVQSGQQQGVGLFGNNALVQAINARGGLVAVGDFDTALPASSAQAATPGWAVAGIVILVLVLVAIVVVMVQLTILLRRD